ncbi:MAG TPA: wax ester/triacylglycerol synthase family O-acyltransferase [Frankiaceae bacterium]|jgi:WS/DGAT/MGAT family acyltransferase|nr:wax ester/triacylglycerol synthase family O-acyltransferase [Frankiaceae bacterium]
MDRLSPLDVSFLYLEGETTPMHVGGVCILEQPPEGFDYDRLVQIISERIATVPRFRQKVRWVPGRLGNPVWVDDSEFDVTYHVRRSALPKPGTEEQLKELTARVQSRPLDRSRPLWEIYLVEGLADGRIAIVTKTHHAMVDGVAAVDVGAVILDLTREPRETPHVEWTPQREPSSVALVADAVRNAVTKPAEIVTTARANLNDVRRVATRAAGVAGGLAATLRSTARSAPESPLNVDIGAQRRFGMARTDLDDYKRVRKEHGGTVNDVVLATVAGALRTWLLTRGESVNGRTVRAMVPVSVRAEGQQLGNRVSSYFVDLPVGEPSPVVRLHQVSYAMSAHKDSGQSVGAEALVAISGFVAPTLHALGARVAAGLSRRLFNVVVTNVPGPQIPLYAAGAEMLEVFPVVPLARGQAVSIGLTSYNGGVYYGLNADRDAMPDVDVLAQCIEESLAELVETAR